MEKLSIEYIAGLIDADGSFSISLSDKRYKGNALTISPVVNFRQLSKYKSVLESIQFTLGAGKIYVHSGKKGVSEMLTWQTTKIKDAIDVARILLPHLKIKKDICRNFILALEEWNGVEYNKHTARNKHQLTRPKELIEKILDTAMNLNAGQQTETAYKNKRIRVLALKERIKKFYS